MRKRGAGALGAVLGACMLAWPHAAGAASPDAGAVAAQVDQSRDWQLQGAADDVHIEVHPSPESDAAARVRVEAITFTGLEEGVTAESLAPVVEPYLHQEQTVGALWDIAARVTDALHRRGFLAAVAVLPEQEVTGGRITMKVILGHYGKIGIENESGLTDARVRGIAHRLVPGDVIKTWPLERTLRVWNEIPGVRAHAYLSPGSEAGAADVLVRLENTERQGGAVFADDYGSRYTGRWRTGLSYHLNGVTHVGDVLSLSLLHGAGDGLDSYDARYEIPVGRDGVTAGVAFYRTDYDLMRQYSKYDAYGMANGWRVFAQAPLARSAAYDADAFFELGAQKMTDRMDAFDMDAEKHDETVRLGFDSTWRATRSATTLRVRHTFGRLRYDNEEARTAAEAGGIAAHFQKTTLDAYEIARLAPALTLHASCSAQVAHDNLDSSEKFYIGGYHGVRAFPQGEAGGDTGVLGSLELRAPLGKYLQAAAFYDAGWVRYAKHPVTAGETARMLAGAGLGFIYQGGKEIYARLDYATPLSDSWSESMGEKNDGMWWFQLIQRF